MKIHRIVGNPEPIHREYGLWIFSYGSRVAPAGDFNRELRKFEFYNLSHMHDGEGLLRMKEEKPQYPIHPGDCVVMPPNLANRYGGKSTAYAEDHISFTGEIADRLFRCGVIRCGVYPIGGGRRVLQIMRLAQNPTPSAQIEANIALQRLLFDIHTEAHIREPKGKGQQIQALVEAFNQNLAQWWTLDEMAEFCGLSRDHFRRVFRREMGEGPKLYLDRLRFAKAAELLSSTSLNLTDLAATFGYSDPFHFSRRFKQIYGIAPIHYRKQTQLL